MTCYKPWCLESCICFLWR